jgi:hypothetical protein
MLRNSTYKYLDSVGTPKDICNMIISYIPNHEYTNVVNEFTVLIHYHNYDYGFSSKNLYKIISVILTYFRKSKRYRMML